MRKSFLLLLVIIAGLTQTTQAQLFDQNPEMLTRKDTLRGSLRPERTCYDVTYYDLKVEVDIKNKFITGNNTIYFTANQNFKTIQIDLAENLAITSIVWGNKKLEFKREWDAVFVSFPDEIVSGSKEKITITYKGNPQVAKNAPWDGGFSWNKDTHNRDWVGISCQGLGASVWWPNKDHLSDEPDSMQITGIVPSELMCIANGNLVENKELGNGKTAYTWKVSYPINNYNVSLNIGHYAHFGEVYTNDKGEKLSMDYYVLDYNLELAKKHFAQVAPMMRCYEQYLGHYPFYKDGFALVETPYLGMEHQSAVAYGNNYRTGYNGYDFSGIGLNFDYIIIHETGHEWWGNHVSVKDIADLWVHEGFCTYSESIYVECMYGYETAMNYIQAMKRNVSNDSPIIGQYNVNKEGSGDMYQKSAVFLNTLRSIIDNDALWWSIIGGIQSDFSYKTVTTQEIETYISTKAGRDFSKEFDQYLRNTELPVLEYRITAKEGGVEVLYRWESPVAGFDMPVRYMVGANKPQWIQPNATWQKVFIPQTDITAFKWDEQHFYFTPQLLEP